MKDTAMTLCSRNSSRHHVLTSWATPAGFCNCRVARCLPAPLPSSTSTAAKTSSTQVCTPHCSAADVACDTRPSRGPAVITHEPSTSTVVSSTLSTLDPFPPSAPTQPPSIPFNSPANGLSPSPPPPSSLPPPAEDHPPLWPASASALSLDPPDWLQRTTLLLGPQGVARLASARVLVVGLGGVGSYVAEFLVRAGVGSLAIVDGDVVDVSNKNRQLPALDSSVGQPKAQVMARRLLDINPDLNLVVRQEFLVPDEAGARLLDEIAEQLEPRQAGRSRGTRSCGEASNSDRDRSRGCSGDAGGSASGGGGHNGAAGATSQSASGASAGTRVGACAGAGSTSGSDNNRGSGAGGCCSGVGAAASAHGGTVSQCGSSCSGAATAGAATGPQGTSTSITSTSQPAATTTTTTTTAPSGSARATTTGTTSPAGPPARLDWVVDCIDSIAPKLALVAAARARGAKVVSSMGAGGRLDPLAVHVADISETYGDPFAATVRRGLRRQYGIRDGVTVVFSTEPCRRSSLALTSARYKRSYYGTISFIPALFGLQIAAHITNVIVEGPMLASEAAQRRQLAAQRGPQTAAVTSGASKSKSKSKSSKSSSKARTTEARTSPRMAGVDSESSSSSSGGGGGSSTGIGSNGEEDHRGERLMESRV